MKLALVVLFLSFFSIAALCQVNETSIALPDSTKKIEKVKAACGICQFGLAGNTCELAVRIKNKTYYVDGTDIDSHGDAHAEDGFCNAIRKAEVQGEVVNNRYHLTYFKLLNTEKKKGSKSKIEK